MHRYSKALGQACLVLATLVATTLCPTRSARAQACQTDVQCPGDLICNGGQCKAEGGAPPPVATVPPPPTAAPPVAPQPTAPPAVAPPPPGSPTAVPVSFTSRQGSPQVRDLITGAECTAPCTLQLEPGPRKIQVGGPEGREETLNIPYGGMALSVGTPSSTLQGTKTVLLAIGIGGVALGALVAIIGVAVMPADEDKGEPGYSEDEDTAISVMAAGGVIAGIGLLSAVAGLIVQAADDDGTVQQARANPLVPRIAVVPLPGDGAFGAASWSF